MSAWRSEPTIAVLLLLGAIGLSACDPGDCGTSEPPEVHWDGDFATTGLGSRDRSMTIDTVNGVVRVETTDSSGVMVVTTWKIRSADEYEAARAAKNPG